MNGKAKTRKAPGFTRSVLAQNIHALMTRDYKDVPKITAKQKKLATGTGLSLSTVQRIMDKDVGASLDNIEVIAEHFDVTVYQLLLPSLNVNDPQVVDGAPQTEKKLYRAWRKERHGELPT